MAYKNLHFCWHGVVSTDVAKAEAFYTNAIGWKAQRFPMGDSEATMFAASDDIARAHLSPPVMEGEPSHWEHYLRVEDVDASAQAAVTNGGALLVPGMDIPPGRFAMVTSPSGAALHLFKESSADVTNAPATGDGAILWVELQSTDLEADLEWMKATLGVTTSSMDMPGGELYYLLHDGNGEPFGGAMTSATPEAPAYWLAWVSVADVDAAVARVGKHGGTALTPPMDMEGVGRMSVIQDSTGGVFGVMKAAPRP